MSAQVTHGADTGRLREIASGLSGLSKQVAGVEQAGSSQLATTTSQPHSVIVSPRRSRGSTTCGGTPATGTTSLTGTW